MQSEIHAYERTKSRSLNDILNSISKNKDPIEYLKTKIEAIILYKEISKDVEIEIIYEKIKSLPKNKAESLNAVALIFGLYVINDYEIDQKILDGIFSSKRFEDVLKKDNVTKIDVIRYARFWILSSKKMKK